MRPHPPPPSEGTPWLAGRGLTTHGSHALQTSSNWSILKRPSTAPVTNVVNLSQKTSIFNEKGVGLTTFVTTTQESTRKTLQIDDVCNKTRRATDQRPSPTGVEGAEAIGGPGRGAGGRRQGQGGASRRRAKQRQRPGPTGVEGAGGTGGPGCGTRGRRRGLAGLRDDAPSRRLAARTAREQAAARGCIKQPGPRDRPHGARNTRGATSKPSSAGH